MVFSKTRISPHCDKIFPVFPGWSCKRVKCLGVGGKKIQAGKSFIFDFTAAGPGPSKGRGRRREGCEVFQEENEFSFHSGGEGRLEKLARCLMKMYTLEHYSDIQRTLLSFSYAKDHNMPSLNFRS